MFPGFNNSAIKIVLLFSDDESGSPMKH